MREEECELALKLVVVGNGAVGKSSMIQRFCKGIFTRDYKKTIGVDFLERELVYDGQDVRLMLWDTAGQEEFDAITKAYYRGAQACVLAYSSTDRASFEAVENWKRKVENEVGNIAMVLVQNKIDLADSTTISEEESENLAKRLKIRLYRTSVKENINIDAVFEYLVQRYLTEVDNSLVEDAQQQYVCSSFLQLHDQNTQGDRNPETHGIVTELQDMQTVSNTTTNNMHTKMKKREKCTVA